MRKKIGEWVIEHGAALDLAWIGLCVAALLATPVLRVFGQPIWELTWALAWGCALGTLLVHLAEIYRRRRNRKLKQKWMHYMPEVVTPMGHDEETEERIVSVQLHGGEVRMIRLPEAYHPAQDGAELILRTACPELFGAGGLFEEDFDLEWRGPE